MRPIVFLSLLGLVGAWFASPAQGGDLTGDEILAKVDSVLNAPKDMVAIEKMTLIEKEGTQKVRDLKFYQKGQWRLVRFLTPADVKGVGFLRLAEDRMYLYMPAFRKIRRIASHVKNERFMGTDFSYEDMSETEYTDNYVAKLSKDEPDQYVLELTPKPKTDVSYSKLVITVDKSTFFYTRIEYYSKRDRLQKILNVENMEKIGGYWMGKTMVMETVKSGHKTVLELAKIEYDTGLSDKIFTQRNLKRAE